MSVVCNGEPLCKEFFAVPIYPITDDQKTTFGRIVVLNLDEALCLHIYALYCLTAQTENNCY